MVAISGPGWHLAPCLVRLFREADLRKPSRSHASDGSIGDPAHSARESDHNPADGWVCAGDVDDDNDSDDLGVDLLVAHLVATKDSRVKYLIRNRTIWKSYANRGLAAWTPQVYTGSNPHDHHAHISVHNTTAARNDMRPWWPPLAPDIPEDDDMALILRGNDSTRSARLLAGPLCSRISADDRVELEKKGVVSVVVDDSTYDAMKGQLNALGLP